MLVTRFGLDRLEVGAVFGENTIIVFENHPDIINPPVVVCLGCLSILVCLDR